MDCIRINELEALAVIGTLPHERTTPQRLIITAELRGDFRAAGKNDDFTLTFDYSAAEQLIYDFVSVSSYQLLEALAENLAQKLLAVPYIDSVRLQICKPGAARIARSIVIEIERTAEKS